MPVPKFRTSASKRDMRRSHHALTAPGISVCSNCNETRQPHRACAACGFYDGRQVMTPRAHTVDADHDHAGHDHAGHDHAGHDHAGHDHSEHKK